MCSDYIGLSSSASYSIYLSRSYLTGIYTTDPPYIEKHIDDLMAAVMGEDKEKKIDFDDIGLTAQIEDLSS